VRALLLNESRALELVEAGEPAPAPGETLIRVAFAGICGSDVHGIQPGGFRTPPLIMGHEFSGTTPEGRRVTVRSTYGCGACKLCRAGKEQLCPDRVILGINRSGGFAEYAVVPDDTVVDLPARASLEMGALVEPLAVALRAWHRSCADASARIGILGSGNIGLLLLSLARHFGAAADVVDVDEHRLSVAEQSGAAQVGGVLRGQYDVIFEAVGSREAHASSLEHLRSGGTAVWLGTRSPDPAFDALDLVRMERSVVSSFAYTPSDFAMAAALTDELSLTWLEIRPLEGGVDAFSELSQPHPSAVKVLLRP
jgi:alcohol dehydrogenase